jgi:hypothetical protein
LRAILLSLVTGLFATNALAADSPVRQVKLEDSARLFPEKVQKPILQQMREIADTYHLDLVVETLEDLPGFEAAPLTWADRLFFNGLGRRRKEVTNWARKQAKTLGVDGVFILIVTQQPHKSVRVIVSPPDRNIGPTPMQCEQLRKDLAINLEDKPGQALLDALTRLNSYLKDKDPNREYGAQAAISMKSAAIILAAMMGISGVLFFIRSRMDNNKEDGKCSAAARWPAMLGAMFGNPASLRVYDLLFEGNPPPSIPIENPFSLFLNDHIPAEPKTTQTFPPDFLHGEPNRVDQHGTGSTPLPY